jgi:hypothetical protein
MNERRGRREGEEERGGENNRGRRAGRMWRREPL